MKTTLASDLLILATKAYANKDYSGAAQLFVTACEKGDITQKDIIAASSEPIEDKVLAKIESDIKVGGPLSLQELKDAVLRIKRHTASASTDSILGDGDDDFDLEIDSDAEDTELPEECEVCGAYPCVCDFDQEGDRETELSSDLREEVKDALVSLKIRAKDWDVKNFTPILISMFPDLVETGKSDRQADIAILAKTILNRLHSIDEKTLVKLHKALQPIMKK